MKNLFYISILIPFTYLVLSCAQPIPPTGGKKDIIPPRLVESTPKQQQINFKGKTVELEFNEYIVIENLQQKLLITPDAGDYTHKVLPKGLRISFKKDLDSAKTYSLSFGDAVKDFAEKNPAKNLRLVFSTGSYIDSASIGGTVKDLLTNQPIFDGLVGLYPNSDTLNIEKVKPYYFTRTDSSGKFSLENLQANRYRLIAFDDKNRSLTYNLKNERIGFLSDSIVVKNSTQISGVSLKLFLANSTPPKVRNTTPRANFYTINYDKGLKDYKVKFKTLEDSIPYFQASPTELKFYNTKNKKDTILVNILVRDSVGQTSEHIQKIKFREAKTRNDITKEPFGIKTNLDDNKQIMPQEINLQLTFNKPVNAFKIDSVKIIADKKPLTISSNDFAWSNNRSILTLKKSLQLVDTLKISFPKSTFLSIENDTLATQNFVLATIKVEDFGILQGEVKNSANKNFIVELVDEEFKVIKSLSNTTPFEFDYIKPAKSYYLRTIIDNNKNGQWDAGNFKTNLQPEPIIYFPNLIKVRKNFVLSGMNIDLSTKN